MIVKIKEHNFDVIYFQTFAFCRHPIHLSLSHLTFNILVKFTINLTEFISRPPSQPAPDPLHLLVQSFDKFRTEKFVRCGRCHRVGNVTINYHPPAFPFTIILDGFIIILDSFLKLNLSRMSSIRLIRILYVLILIDNYPECFYFD